jgi:hypothetical protein
MNDTMIERYNRISRCIHHFLAPWFDSTVFNVFSLSLPRKSGIINGTLIVILAEKQHEIHKKVS